MFQRPKAERHSLDLHISRSGGEKLQAKMSELSDDCCRHGAAVPSRSGVAECLYPPLSGSTAARLQGPPAGQRARFSELKLPGQSRYFGLSSLFCPFITLYASSCILADLHAHATITIDGRRRARRRLAMLQPMGARVSRRLPLSTNSVTVLTPPSARQALSGLPRLTGPRDCFFKVAPRRLARASRNTHTTHSSIRAKELCVHNQPYCHSLITRFLCPVMLNKYIVFHFDLDPTFDADDVT